MRTSEVEDVIRCATEPMTVAQIAEYFEPHTNVDLNFRAKKNVARILNNLSKYKIAEIVANEIVFPHTNYWAYVRD